MISSGSYANHTGQELEKFVERCLQDVSYQITDGKWLYKNRKTVEGRLYARQVYVGESFYEGKKRVVDSFVVNADVFPDALIIEGKWQEAQGSVEEKFPYTVLSIRKTGIPTIIVLDGDGYSEGAKRYLRKEVDGRVLLAVWTMTEFQRAKNNGFFGTGVMPVFQSVKPVEDGNLWRMLDD